MSTSLHYAYSPHSSFSRPRRRTSLSISLTSTSIPPAPRRRARTMPLPGSPRSRKSDKPVNIRKMVIILLALLSLILTGTVIVLSTVSYYLAIPNWAYLTETEVAWRPQDVIKQLRDSDPVRIHKRLEWREVGQNAHKPLNRKDSAIDKWDKLGEEMYERDAAQEADLVRDPALLVHGNDNEGSAMADVVTTRPGDEWGIDGEGSGGYWMRKDWNGRVQDVSSWDRLYNVTTLPGETIPRLIHQTWKDDHLPEQWRKAWKECREGMPDYEYMLWTDEVSREFIAAHYPAHLEMYDSYQYPIQRADSIRYFLLHHFGGVYMDLDIGCRRRLDPLLQGDWEVILPITKPVGISNDLMLSSKGSKFMDDTVHGLHAFNHQYFSNYPTIMFSTGPMFLSAQYAFFSSAHPPTFTQPSAPVRVLPKSLYGKNTPVANVPHSFFIHFYGSSWHADDAGFITFLGQRGKKMMWFGVVVLILGIARLIWMKKNNGRDYQLYSILPTTQSRCSSPTEYGSIKRRVSDDCTEKRTDTTTGKRLEK
ncbi:uncharacterized protein L203_102356 [Cryptococcus depauperatus CBS 7841]|uniref:Uncharacterized protein n=1 Tax=Cryptococcus depauperatus CBS 7841 TaxID=1295531 RepID=A0A1E3IA86_9TREE|nr:MIPC synthase [Cryptococcus depauperatus CBS 7841]